MQQVDPSLHSSLVSPQPTLVDIPSGSTRTGAGGHLPQMSYHQNKMPSSSTSMSWRYEGEWNDVNGGNARRYYTPEPPPPVSTTASRDTLFYSDSGFGSVSTMSSSGNPSPSDAASYKTGRSPYSSDTTSLLSLPTDTVCPIQQHKMNSNAHYYPTGSDLCLPRSEMPPLSTPVNPPSIRGSMPELWSPSSHQLQQQQQSVELWNQTSHAIVEADDESVTDIMDDNQPRMPITVCSPPSRRLCQYLYPADSERFSRKVFVGGLPIDIEASVINRTFGRFGALMIDWPRRTEHNYPPRGYVFLVFEQEQSVQALVQCCHYEEDKYYIFLSSPTMKNKPVQVRPWRLADADYVREVKMPCDPRKTVFIGGVPRPLRAVELAELLDNKYNKWGSVCYAGIDTDPELKYPKGAARVTFTSQAAFTRALTDRFVQIHHTEADKRVEIKPYVMDDQLCDECHGDRCNGKYASLFCSNVECLQYYCDACWPLMHTSRGRTHRPMIKLGQQSKSSGERRGSMGRVEMTSVGMQRLNARQNALMAQQQPSTIHNAVASTHDNTQVAAEKMKSVELWSSHPHQQQQQQPQQQQQQQQQQQLQQQQQQHDVPQPMAPPASTPFDMTFRTSHGVPMGGLHTPLVNMLREVQREPGIPQQMALAMEKLMECLRTHNDNHQPGQPNKPGNNNVVNQQQQQQHVFGPGGDAEVNNYTATPSSTSNSATPTVSADCSTMSSGGSVIRSSGSSVRAGGDGGGMGAASRIEPLKMKEIKGLPTLWPMANNQGADYNG